MDSNVMTRRARSAPAERAQWRERFAQSGLSRREFAAQNDLRLQTLDRWLNEMAGGPGRRRKTAFTEVPLPALAVAARWAAELVHRDGTVLRLAHDVPAALLKQLLPPC